MQDFDKTTRFKGAAYNIAVSSDLSVTVFDMNAKPQRITLNSFNKSTVTFGREAGNDIVLQSDIVSREHGRFSLRGKQWYIEDKSVYSDRGSTNGLIFNGSSIDSKPVYDGDLIRIDDGVETTSDGVLLIFSSAASRAVWNVFPIPQSDSFTIGRGSDCDIVLTHISVSKYHAKITRENNAFYITDNGSTNGVVINNKALSGKARLHEKDVITITNSKLIFTSTAVYYCSLANGISVEASNIVIYRGKGQKRKVTCNKASLSVKPGELVAFVGGSGAGKSTIMNAISGYLPPDNGAVYINGVDLYQNFDSLKRVIGYVPQSDIVYDNLTLFDMLKYTAKLRLPKDTSEQEREIAIERAINLVELSEFKNRFIKRLSGGQRKRASIAVELLSDPNLLFLDEPASGLDPATERSLMTSLRGMANSGKTIMLVTHSTLQLKLCDKIVFMGKGGNLCFCGSYEDALAFFGVSDVIDIYELIADAAQKWREKYDASTGRQNVSKTTNEKIRSNKKKSGFQLPVLCSRYAKLILNDRQRLILLFAQAPILALLISLVANGQQFAQYEMTKSLLFALACCAFWLGMLNSIQEICKERNIIRREYMTGLSLGSYIISKILVLGVVCMIQSVLIVGVFALAIGLPDKGILFDPFSELLITTFLTALSAASTGLFISSFFTNADKATSVAPLMLMPQILFSGLIFKLSGAAELISWFAVCRWSMEGYGTTADLNDLELRLQQEGIMIPHESESFYEFTTSHILTAWGILAVFCIGFLVLTRIVMINLRKEKS